MSNALIIICTRPHSSRLPEKVFREIAGYPALEHILRRIETAGFPIVLATDGDKRYEKFKRRGVDIYVGEPESPLHRMAAVAKRYNHGGRRANYIIRITHDDILIDREEMSALLKACEQENAGYGISEGILDGAGVEVIHVDNLYAAIKNRKEPTEFVSYFVRGEGMPKPDIVRLAARDNIRKPYRLTMDYLEDAIVIEDVLRKVGPFASNDDICDYLDRNPCLLEFNRLPEVSIYTCAYNAEQWISSLIPNVMLPNRGIEYVIVEDGSVDRTLDRLIEMQGYGYRLIVNERNLGHSSACNVALKACRGRYVMRVDADDRIRPEAIAKMVERIKKDNSAIVYSDYEEVDEDLITKGAIKYGKIHHHAGCALMDMKMINEIRFTEGLKHWDSLDLYQRVKKHKMPVSYISEPLWFYRRHPKSLSAEKSEERKKALESVIVK